MKHYKSNLVNETSTILNKTLVRVHESSVEIPGIIAKHILIRQITIPITIQEPKGLGLELPLVLSQFEFGLLSTSKCIFGCFLVAFWQACGSPTVRRHIFPISNITWREGVQVEDHL
jgi:hypothetical protein